jgi:choline dehydrogenase-like flavoprotein
MARVTRVHVDVAVLGAGLAGLSAALGLARSGRRVMLLERDGPGADDGADLIFERWERPGIAQFRQPHNFLALARQVAFSVFVGDNRTFSLVLMIPPWDRELRALRSEQGLYGRGPVHARASAVGRPGSVCADHASAADGQPA